MVSRILALIVWAAVAASVAYWGLRWFAKPIPVPPGTGSVALNVMPHGDLSKLLKAPSASNEEAAVDPGLQSALSARIQLLGVLAPRPGESGPSVALMALDGKPARAFKIGHTVDGNQVVQGIDQQGVQIGPQGGQAAVNLNLPLLPPPATGVLPSVDAQGAGLQAEPGNADAASSEGSRRLPPRLRRQQQPNERQQPAQMQQNFGTPADADGATTPDR